MDLPILNDARSVIVRMPGAPRGKPLAVALLCLGMSIPDAARAAFAAAVCRVRLDRRQRQWIWRCCVLAFGHAVRYDRTSCDCTQPTT